jgi:GAF domain-containing protein
MSIASPHMNVETKRPRWPAMDDRSRLTAPIATAAARTARKTMRQIARSAVPALADFAVVFVVAGRSIAGVASAHATPGGDKVLRALLRVYHIRLDDLRSTVAQVVRTGRPTLRRYIPQGTPPRAPRGSVADLHHRLACRSALVLPIRAGQIVAGAVSLCYAGSGRTFAPADLAAARRVVRALERATAPPLPHAASRLRAATGDPGRHATVRRRVASRN